MIKNKVDAIVSALKYAADLAKFTHNPLNHDTVKSEKACRLCQFQRRLDRLIKHGEKLI